jgi:hypothetical protein
MNVKNVAKIMCCQNMNLIKCPRIAELKFKVLTFIFWSVYLN